MIVDERSNKLALALLFLNILLVLFGLFAFAWQPASRSVYTAAPSNLSHAHPAPAAVTPSC